MADIYEQGNPWPLCPRGFLRRQIEQLSTEFDLALQVGLENEFYLLKPTDDGFTYIENSLFCSVNGFNQHQAHLDMILQDLMNQGIKIENVHAESGAGQLEISMQPTDALTMADQQLVLRETVHAVAHKHNLLASFLPRFHNKWLAVVAIFTTAYGNKMRILPRMKPARANYRIRRKHLLPASCHICQH